MGRLVRYWSLICLLYIMYLALPWIQVGAGQASVPAAAALTSLAVLGNLCLYCLIRASKRLGLTPAQLSVYQGRFAIVIACLNYTIVGPLRGASLVGLLVVLVFCAFTLQARSARSLSIFAVSLLAAVMLAMSVTDPAGFDARTELIHFVLIGTMVIVVGILTGRMSDLRAALRLQKEELTEVLARLQEMADRDELTRLPNRRCMLEHLQTLNRRKADAACCLAVLDIDHFKGVNDTYGHAVGDEVLRRFAAEGLKVLRPTDVLARWGGEEFLLLLPGTDLPAAREVLARFVGTISQIVHVHEERRFNITVSAGVVELEPGEAHDVAICRADTLLYRAKAAGRNRVVAGSTEAAKDWGRRSRVG